MARLVLPARAPTGLYQLSHVENALVGFTRLAKVSTPSTAQPMPPASSAAATGPFGLSILFSIIRFFHFLRSLDRCNPGNQRAEKPGNRSSSKSKYEEDHDRLPYLGVPAQLRPKIAGCIGCYCGGNRRQPGNVLLPFHSEIVPALGDRAGYQEIARKCAKVIRARRRDRTVPGINDIRPG